MLSSVYMSLYAHGLEKVKGKQILCAKSLCSISVCRHSHCCYTLWSSPGPPFDEVDTDSILCLPFNLSSCCRFVLYFLPFYSSHAGSYYKFSIGEFFGNRVSGNPQLYPLPDNLVASIASAGVECCPFNLELLISGVYMVNILLFIYI